MSQRDIGMVGLGVMGRNLALNLADKGFSVGGWDAWPEPVQALAAAGAASSVLATTDLAELVCSLARPRRLVMLVKAGQVVDDTIERLVPLLEEGDVLVDAGNEHFTNTERRAASLDARGIRFFGMGVSGGESGARHGPSLMPGGHLGGYEALAPVLSKIAAQVEDGACVTYVGPGGSGHYVKMVHNGIEYADMQLIAETYDLLAGVAGLDNDRIADVFDEWNQGELESFLVEITGKILRRRDEESGRSLVDVIVDRASMKGTGKWTVMDAQDLGAPVPTIAASVDARVLSSMTSARALAQRVDKRPRAAGSSEDAHAVIADARSALYAAKVASYAQGLSLIAAASALRSWNVNISELARIWKAGCIIRARLLGRVQQAFAGDARLESLLFAPDFAVDLAGKQDAWRRTVTRAVARGVPVPALAASLGYYDTLGRERLPANLIQAQRDFFGAHRYERIDREGTFHTEWEA